MPQLLKLLVLVFASVLLSGCKIAAIVVEGGSLYSAHPRCEAGNICIYEVTDTNFQKEFVARPDRGWIFDRWQAGDHFLCGDSRQRSCTVSLSSLEEETADKIISSSETSYLMPIFQRARDVIEVDGKEWYQPYLFAGLSWSEINDACPDGTCTGMLNSQDMTGWTWASVKDMNDLFNYYIGSKLLGPGPDNTFSGLDELESSVFRDGLVPTDEGSELILYVKTISGLTKNGLNTGNNQAYAARLSEGEVSSSIVFYEAQTDIIISKDDSPYSFGAWFYRLP